EPPAAAEAPEAAVDSPVLSDTPTTSTEETAVKEQIETFISNQPTEPPAAVEPQAVETPAPETTTPETPAPPSAEPAASTNEVADQAMLTSAVDTIVANGNAEAADEAAPA